MYAMPEGYKEAIEGQSSQIDVFIAIGTNIDPTSSDDIVAIEGDFLPMSNAEQVTDANYQMTEWMATFENDGIKTAVDAGNLAPPLTATAYPPQVGLWSNGISDADGNIDFTLTVRLGGPHTSAFTVFTYDSNILDATVTYYNGNEITRTSALAYSKNRAQDATGSTYDRIVVHITKIDQPFTHVKISELEFGASETYGKTRLAGSVTLVQEWDPTMRSIPLYELDFSILNVMGDFDTDNPNGQFASIKQDYPVELSFSIQGNSGVKYTVPCGRFMIASRRSTEDTLEIVAYDARSALEQNRGGMKIMKSQSFGDMFTALFKALHIPFVADESLFVEFPDQDMVFNGEDYDLLTIMRFLEQYYGIWLIPERIGSIRVTKQVPNDDYGQLNTNLIVSFPRSNVAELFNYISVSYGTEDNRQEFVRDLRTDPAQLRSQIAINNPLVQTIEKAREIADKVNVALFSNKVVTEWLGDPSLDITDGLNIEGRWTQGSPTQYRGIYQELTYDGGIISKTDTYN